MGVELNVRLFPYVWEKSVWLKVMKRLWALGEGDASHAPVEHQALSWRSTRTLRRGRRYRVLWNPASTLLRVYWTDVAAAEEAIARMVEGRPGVPRRTFDRNGPGLAGHAYLLPEGDGHDRYWGLNTWTASRKSVACVTFYFQHLAELNWALQAWQSVRCGVEAARNLN